MTADNRGLPDQGVVLRGVNHGHETNAGMHAETSTPLSIQRLRHSLNRSASASTTVALWVTLLGLSIGATGPAPAHGATVSPPPSKRAERLSFDPVTNRWTQTRAPIPGTEDGDLEIARQWMARGEYDTALDILEDWIDQYGPSSPRYPEALYLEGSAHLERGDYRSANDTYHALLADFPGSMYAEKALSGRFRVAEQYLAGKRRRALGGLMRVKDRDGGVEILDEIVANYPDTSLAEQAQLAKANYYYERGEFELAEDEYARFVREFPRSRYQAKALLWSAYAALASFPGIHFDDAPLIEARERFVQFTRSYPGQAQQFEVSTLLEQIEATRADKTFEIGWFYERTGQQPTARYYYEALIERWPETPGASQARSRLEIMGEIGLTEPMDDAYYEPEPAAESTSALPPPADEADTDAPGEGR